MHKAGDADERRAGGHFHGRGGSLPCTLADMSCSRYVMLALLKGDACIDLMATFGALYKIDVHVHPRTMSALPARAWLRDARLVGQCFCAA